VAQDQVMMVLFIIAAVLGLVAAIIPEASGRLTPLAVAFAALGLAVGAAR
jgi:hypothetical protein